jgi:DNA-directed RNA polymerase beta subunit
LVLVLQSSSLTQQQQKMASRKKRSRASNTNMTASVDEPSSSRRRRRDKDLSASSSTMSDKEIADASRPVKDLKDKWLLIPEYLRVKGLVRQHIESYNHFLTHQIAKIIETNNEVKSTVDPHFFVKYVGVRVGTPSMEVQFDEQLVTPNQCRLQDLTYAAPIYVDVHYRRGGKVISKKDVRIGWVPIMLKSSKCVLTGKSESELAKLSECPLDPGGYFICKGNEKVIQIQEQIAHNRLIVEVDGKGGYVATITSNSHAKKSRANCTMASNGKVYFKHNTLGQEVPIVIMLKALGATSDIESEHYYFFGHSTHSLLVNLTLFFFLALFFSFLFSLFFFDKHYN